VKSVPIQFFKDGLPAPEQKLWHSPWGEIAMCVCYDMSYRRVMDRFMKQGAQALIVPFMDVADWGEHQHRLHAKVGSLRAQEYGIPIFRLGSSGISQLIDKQGRIRKTAPFPGQEQMIGGTLEIGQKATLPFDSVLAPASVLASALILLFTIVDTLRRRFSQKALAQGRTVNTSRPGEQ
jgi:apolipoprotein N-acyltransferase